MADDQHEHTPLKALRDQVTHYTHQARSHRTDVDRSMARVAVAELKAAEFAEAVAVLEAASK